MFFSTLEHVDFFTDGTYPVQAYACDDILTPKFAYSFETSYFPSAAFAIMHLRFWGIVTIFYLAAFMSQQAAASNTWNANAGLATTADSATFAAVAAILKP